MADQTLHLSVLRASIFAVVCCLPMAALHAQDVPQPDSTSAGDQIGAAPLSPLSKPGANDDDQQAPPPDKGTKQTLPPPPSLPGSHAQPTPVAPATRAVSDMDPTAALFDAINRGDMVAVRDSLNRGADTAAHNVLGLTPLALSVDLGRNDISFLLLSLRTTEASVAPPLIDTGRSSGGHATGGAAATPSVPVASTRTAAAAPAAGFLGFGGGS
jgi:hypothetical protein